LNQDVDAKTMAKAFKALSNPNRLTIYLEILSRHEASEGNSCQGCLIADVMSEMNIGAPTVSHHVKELVNADLIEVERQGKFVNCYINDVMHEQLRHFFTLNKHLATS
jgi:ArsR family transcriptional regulator